MTFAHSLRIMTTVAVRVPEEPPLLQHEDSAVVRPDRRSTLLLLRSPAPLWCVITMGTLLVIFAVLFLSGGEAYSSTSPSVRADKSLGKTSEDNSNEKSDSDLKLEFLLRENSRLKAENERMTIELEKATKVLRSPGMANISWDAFPDSAGPVTQRHRSGLSSIVLFCVGERGRRNVKNLLPKFPPSNFLYIFFVYDNSNWENEAALIPGIWVYAKGQLKWWFVKRFAPPMIAALYDFIWIVEEDVQMEFDPLEYSALAIQQRWDLSKPASVDTGRDIVRPAKAAGQLGARYTDFLELDPVLVISSRAWPCFWSVLLGEASTGWGLDLIMCNYLTERCGTSLPPVYNSNVKEANVTAKGTTGCVVVDSFEVRRDASLPPRKLQQEGWKEASLYKNVYQGLEAQVRVHDPPQTNQKP